MSRRRWWIVSVAVVVVLVVAAGLSWQYARPRLPSVASAVTELDQAIAGVITAVGDQAAVSVSDLTPSTACQDTPFAKGHLYARTADLYTAPGQEAAVIALIGAAPPSGVTLQVGKISAGWIAATAKTGCRSGTAVAGDASGGTAPALTSVLTTLGTTAATWHTDTVPCTGGQIVTVSAASQSTDTDKIATRLTGAIPTGATVFPSSGNGVAWRDNGTSVIIGASDDGTQITAQQTTVTC